MDLEVSHYRVLEQIGSGGMGACMHARRRVHVHRAHQVCLHISVLFAILSLFTRV